MRQKELAPGYVPKLRTYIQNFYIPFFADTDIRDIRSCKNFGKKLPYMSLLKKLEYKINKTTDKKVREKLEKFKSLIDKGKIEDAEKLCPEEKIITLSPKYQKNILDALRGFFLWANEERIIKVDDIPIFPSIKVPEYESQAISPEVQLAILDLIPDEHKPIFTFLFYQGARPGEIRALKWDCINGDTVTYKRTFSGRKLKENTKTSRIRHNLIFPEVLSMLPKKDFPRNFVFTHGGNKKPYSEDFLGDIYKEALKAFREKHNSNLNIGLYEATKHSFGTEFINEHPEHEKLLQEWFGHTKPEMTRKYEKFKVVEAFRKLQNITKIHEKASDETV